MGEDTTLNDLGLGQLAHVLSTKAVASGRKVGNSLSLKSRDELVDVRMIDRFGQYQAELVIRIYRAGIIPYQ